VTRIDSIENRGSSAAASGAQKTTTKAAAADANRKSVTPPEC
jgi:hypothetical protein